MSGESDHGLTRRQYVLIGTVGIAWGGLGAAALRRNGTAAEADPHAGPDAAGEDEQPTNETGTPTGQATDRQP